jgi:cyclase
MMIPTTSKHYSLEQLSDGVYAAIAKDGGAAIGNAGLVDLGDSTLVIDTFIAPSAAEDLRADALRLTGRFPNHVIVTHYHNDHIWGNQAFLPEADFIGTEATRRLIQTAGKEEYDYYQAITEERLKLLRTKQEAARVNGNPDPGDADAELMIGFFSGLSRDLPRTRVILPNILFENHLILNGSKRRAELIAFSDAHTGNDTVVFLPDDGILFMSDLLFIGHHAYLGDGNPGRWHDLLNAIPEGKAGINHASLFVPGHGPTGNAADLKHLAEYIRDCQQIAQGLVSQGQLDQEAISAVSIPEAYATWRLQMFFQANLKFLVSQYKTSTEGAESSTSDLASNSYRP